MFLRNILARHFPANLANFMGRHDSRASYIHFNQIPWYA